MTEALPLQDQSFVPAFGHIRHDMQMLYLYLEGALLLALVNGNDNTQRAKPSPSCPPGRQSQNKVVSFSTNIIACFAIYLLNYNWCNFPNYFLSIHQAVLVAKESMQTFFLV